MAAQTGRTMLLKLGDGAGPEVFSTLGGLQAKTLTLGDQTVDVTDQDSNGYRELLPGRVMQTMAVSGSGVFKDSAAENSALSVFQSGTHRNWQIVIPNLGTFQGKFRVTELAYTGNHDGALTYTLSLESDGEISFA